MAANQDAPPAAVSDEKTASARAAPQDMASEDSATEMNVGDDKTTTVPAPTQTSSNPGSEKDDDTAKAMAEAKELDGANTNSSNVPGVDDQNIVFWDGDDDPHNPYNWKSWIKVFNCVLISALTFVTPLASCTSTYLEALA